MLDTTILVDADYGYDKKTGCSVTGLILLLGSTPVLWISKRQGAITCSTYHAEFSALFTVAEKAVTIRYLLSKVLKTSLVIALLLSKMFRTQRQIWTRSMLL